ncbi:MAG: serine hydrolase [Burkholderiales bacterium]|nr:beta-lactamase family protein [Burkholderiales bacterium]MDE1927590.1 serine hydrolase [Burkholderiales bacterium]MDE2158619.1 serine hydrolase [Burkholderiales bacterium]MDE2505179.1 serine hydrolase [Burkholderiales bacterium]
MKHPLICAAAAALLATPAVQAQAPKPPLDAAATDPARLGWMVGSPPPADKLIRWADMSFFRFPQYRWTFAHFRRLLPTTNISRGDGPVAVLPRAERSDIDGVTFHPLGSTETMTWAQSLQANYTDAIVVLHRGRIVYERYFGVMNPSQPHIAMSVTKSYFGTLAAMLVAEGKLDPDALVTRYIPEMKDTAYGDATVREVMDMTIGVKYSEDYADPKAEIWDHVRAGGVFPRPPGYSGPQSFQQFLLTLRKEGEHGQAFAYKTVNADVLGWLIERASGEPVGRLLDERIWSKLGAEHDAYMIVDSTGYEFAGGGFNATLRDMARFGEMMRLEGRYNGRQIVPKAVVDEIRRGGSRALFAKAGFSTLPGWSYHDMWWVSHDEDGVYAARGIYGQTLYIDPKADMVIARFASYPQAANAHLDPTTLPAFRALAKFLMR